ncbi:MAG: S1 RNA-binding domain-containing protein [Candidatus Lokiarchaeota archaeon]|nr:S1 RNA-binding domain-containing protein [Candidatus Harpocratesius repetitus]
MLNRNPFPEPGELVVCRVTNVQRGYVQVELEDYAGLPHEERAQGMVHISELSNRWVKNINSIVSIGQRLVLQVIRVNKDRGYLDLSLRRVNKIQRTTVMNQWRYAIKLEGLLNFFAEQHGMTLSDLYEKAIWALIDQYGEIRNAFETIKEDGFEALINTPGLDISEDLQKELYKLIIENITISKVNLQVEFDIRSFEGNGIEVIKEGFAAVKRLRKPKGVEISFAYIGAPIYRMNLEAKDYHTAEKFLEKVHKKFEETIGHAGSVKLLREDLSNEQ